MVEHMECPRAFLGKLVPEHFSFFSVKDRPGLSPPSLLLGLVVRNVAASAPTPTHTLQTFRSMISRITTAGNYSSEGSLSRDVGQGTSAKFQTPMAGFGDVFGIVGTLADALGLELPGPLTDVCCMASHASGPDLGVGGASWGHYSCCPYGAAPRLRGATLSPGFLWPESPGTGFCELSGGQDRSGRGRRNQECTIHNVQNMKYIDDERLCCVVCRRRPLVPEGRWGLITSAPQGHGGF